jgi:nitrogen fixation NifU-like protein
MNTSELYKSIILDHGTNPRNRSRLQTFNHEAIGFNPLCGDKVHIFFNLVDNLIDQISFVGEGCAICIASSSVMTEVLKNKSNKEVIDISKYFINGIINKNQPFPIILNQDNKTKLNSFMSVGEFPMRIKCATLPWIAIESELEKKSKKIVTDKLN